MKRAKTLLVLCLLPLRVMASGHGPIFGLATPTNSQGEWSFDQGVFGRSTRVGSQASIREILGYGFTPHFTLSFTLPVVVGDTRLPPTRIQPGDDFDFGSSGMAISAQGNEGGYSHREHCLRWSRRSRPTVCVQRCREHIERPRLHGWRSHRASLSQPLRVAWSYVHQVR